MAIDIDDFTAAAAIAGTDKLGVAQGDAIMKRAPVSALLTYISANIGTTFTRTILDDATAGDVQTTIGISTFVKTILDDANAAAVLTTLGISAFAQTLLDDAAATNVLTTLGVSAFVQTILDDAAAGNVLTTLGISAFIQTLLDDADQKTAQATLGVEVVDSVFASYATNTNITAVIPLDDTIPQIGEGIEILSVSITPKTTTNRLRARVNLNGASAGTTAYLVAALFAAGGANALVAASNHHAAADRPTQLNLLWEWVPGVTTAVTVAVRVGPGTTGTIRMNGTSAGRLFGGAASCTLVVEEIQA